MAQFLTASNSYKLALDKCREDPKLMTSSIYKKAGNNYAVALEKLNRRDKAFKHLHKMNQQFEYDIRVQNNLGILQKRDGHVEEAIASYKKALEIDPLSFFANYNLGMLLTFDKNNFKDSIQYLQIVQEQSNRTGDVLYELNVLINLAVVQETVQKWEDALFYMERALQLDPFNRKIQDKVLELRHIVDNLPSACTPEPSVEIIEI